MKVKKHKVLRSRIYMGEVIIPHVINRYEDYSVVVEYQPVRYSIYELDNNKAVDLLNDVDNYEVAECNPDVLLDEICIAHSVYLGYLLEYLDFKDELDYKDICYIRDLLFGGDFAKSNPELFGILTSENGELKREEGLIDSYYYRLFDSLGKNKLSEVLIGPKDTMDPFKTSLIEIKKKLVR